MQFLLTIILVLLSVPGISQPFDTSKYKITVTTSPLINGFFTKDKQWRGADGAAAVDMGNGKVLWLFSDGFIADNNTGLRSNATFIRNSIAIQEGYDLKNARLKFYWNKSSPQPISFFHLPGKSWFWTGHGIMIKDKLLVFLMNVKDTSTGLGFEINGWSVALISNPNDTPAKWKIKYIKGTDTFGYIPGSAAVLKDQNFLYAYGSTEPATHEVYLIRWAIDEAYKGNFINPQWFNNGKWELRKNKEPAPQVVFTGQTEYSVHYDSSLKKFIQIQSYGFGEAKVGIRMAGNIYGPWTEPYIFFLPDYSNIKKPFMYSAKAHPELKANGIYITYNVNSFDANELAENKSIYFPRFVLIKIDEKK